MTFETDQTHTFFDSDDFPLFGTITTTVVVSIIYNNKSNVNRRILTSTARSSTARSSISRSCTVASTALFLAWSSCKKHSQTLLQFSISDYLSFSSRCPVSMFHGSEPEVLHHRSFSPMCSPVSLDRSSSSLRQ